MTQTQTRETARGTVTLAGNAYAYEAFQCGRQEVMTLTGPQGGRYTATRIAGRDSTVQVHRLTRYFAPGAKMPLFLRWTDTQVTEDRSAAVKAAANKTLSAAGWVPTVCAAWRIAAGSEAKPLAREHKGDL